MECIKENLSHDYNEAIKNYNEGNFVFFFRNIRPVIENFCKFIIYDLMGVKMAEELLVGEKSIKCDFKTGEATFEEGNCRPVESSYLTILAKLVIYYKYGHELIRQERKSSMLKKAIDSDFSRLNSDYGICSEIGGHTGETSLDIKIEAQNLSSFMPKVFSNLRTILSKEAISFLFSLDKPKDHVEIYQNPEAQQIELKNNDLLILDELTNRFEQIAGLNYIAFIPSKIEDNYGHNLTEEQIKDFYRVQWNLVIDMNPKTPDGLFEHAPLEKKSSIRIVTGEINEVIGSNNITNWMFAKGRIDLRVFDEKNVLRNAPGLFNSIFSKIVRTGLTNEYIIFDFCEDYAKKISIKLLDKLENIFDSWDIAASRCKIVSFTTNEDYKRILKEWSNDYGVQCTIIHATFCDFINHLIEVKPIEESGKTKKLLLRGNSLDLTEARERYKAVGIDFFAPLNESIDGEHKWDFYSGAEITWEELDKQYDVLRDIYRNIKQRVTDIIKTTRRVSVYTLRHRPGSGATTLSRRLGYDIKKDDESGTVSCTVISIKNCSNIRLTASYLSNLSESVENTAILAIVESKHVGREKFDNLVKRMADAGKKILFFYVEPFTGNNFGQQGNVAFLASYLNINEQNRFEDKYRQQGLLENLLEKAKRNNTRLEVIDFPLMLKDRETSNNLQTYVNEWMDVLPEKLRKFCAYVAFAFKYSESGVNQVLLKSIWKDESHLTINFYAKEQIKALAKLLIEETSEDGKSLGIWRPRYNRFSDFILSAYKSNWKDSIPRIAKDFISLCKEAGELGSDDKDMLYSIFIIRKTADYRAIEDTKKNLRNKFSLLIKDLNDVERAESLFLSLVDAFPKDAVFRGHYARFLYEKATTMKDINIDDRLFHEAQSQLDFAFLLNPNDADLYHMQGMLLRRRIKTLFKMCQKSSYIENIEDIQDFLIEWTQNSYDAFEKSIQLNPVSPYGYAAESQLFKEAIELGNYLLKTGDYTFCETNHIYADYTEKLGDILDRFEQICYAFKSDGLPQISGSYAIYEEIRAFHQRIVGNNIESIRHYRNMYGRSSGEKKSFYGDLLIKSIVYSKKSSIDTRKAYSNLTRNERKEIEDILEFQKNQGNVKSYETLFLLKLYGHEEYSLDDAIDLLKEWESQYESENLLGLGYLNACFYLGVCYCSKAILGEVLNREISSLAMMYFKKAEDLSKYFDRYAVKPRCYLGERSDIHCIVDKEENAGIYSGVINNIKDSKGFLNMLCGLEVTFRADKKFDIMRDEGKVLNGVIGFSYSGPGLYNYWLDSNRELTDMYITEQKEEDVTYEELSKSYVPVEDLVEDKTDLCDDSDKTMGVIKTPIVNGHIDLSTIKDRTKKRFVSLNLGSIKSQKEEQEYEGVIVMEGRYKKIKCDSFPNYSLPIEGCDQDEFYEDEEVIFVVKSRPQDKNPLKPYYYATNMRLKED